MSLEKAKTVSIMAIVLWLMFFLAIIPISTIALTNGFWHIFFLYPGILLAIILRLPLKLKDSHALKILKNTISLLIILALAFGYIKALGTLNERDLIAVFIFSASLSTVLTLIMVLIAYFYATSRYRTAEHYIKEKRS